MGRCFLKGLAGDAINAILAAAGLNLRKLLRGFLFALISWLSQLEESRFGASGQRDHALAIL
jgi:hypothetical protein